MTGVQAVDAPAVAERVAGLRARLDALAAGRRVEIVAVTKGFGTDAVAAAAAAGITRIGENYAQELTAKAPAAPPAIEWHFIGGLQRNKVAVLAPLVALWQTVDRAALAATIARHAPGAAVLVQINLAAAQSRAGCTWDEAPGLVATCRAAGLDVRGVMGVGPERDPRPAFRALARFAHDEGLDEVSMGMTGDLDVAVEEGSTMVRVGTALFGPRPPAVHLRR